MNTTGAVSFEPTADVADGSNNNNNSGNNGITMTTMDRPDPLQAALLEAETLMESLGTTTDGGIGGSFAIDSDDDDDVLVDEDIGLHPLHEAYLIVTPPVAAATTSTVTTESSSTTNATYSATTGASAPSALFYNNNIPTNATNGNIPYAQPPTQSLPFLSTTPMFSSTTTSTSSNTSSSGNHDTALQNFGLPTGPTLDVFKASTSRFASNLANMAQRAANQVSTAVGTPTSMSSSSNFHSAAATATAAAPMHNSPYHYPSPTAAQSTTTPSTSMSNNSSGYSNSTTSYQQLSELDAEQKAILIQSHVGDLIPGERIIMFLQNVQHVSDSTGLQYNDVTLSASSSLWCCAMTYYRLLLFSTHPIQSPIKPNEWNAACWPPNPSSILQIPLSNIDKVEKSVFTATTAATGFGSMNVGTSATPMSLNLAGTTTVSNTLTTTTIMGLIVHDKLNGRQIRFTTQSYPDTNRAYEALHTYSFPGRRNLGYLFAFESKREQVMASIETDAVTGNKKVTLPPFRKRFDAEPEYQRQFTNASYTNDRGPWTIWHITNASYHLCHSYPSILVGPISIDERLNPDKSRIISHCAAFRSEQRLPALTWCGVAGSSIWRCSQPKVGLQGNRSSADEQYLKHIMECAASARSMSSVNDIPPRSILVQLTGTPDPTNWMPNNVGLKILDLRPRSSAMANRTGGYGYENTSHYSGCSIQFCNIGNIHAVRDSYQKLSQVCLHTMSSDLQFVSQVEDTKWLSHIRVIWAAAWETAFWVQIHKIPVLVHCSHGWDRTSQVVALSQLLLDPYYRTMSGFSCLVEKDFMSFGHPFHLRCSHGEGRDGASNASSVNGGNGSTIDEGQVSPIFLQFIDCVYQVVRLYPEAFEFNTKYLLLLTEHIYSGRFGNFLCDSEREREIVAGVRQRTHSVWDYLDEQRSDVVNMQYCPNSSGAGVLLMPLPTLLRNITLWTDRHCMYSPKPTMRWLPSDMYRPIHSLNHDQPSDLITEQETYQLLYKLPKQTSKTSTDTPQASKENKLGEIPATDLSGTGISKEEVSKSSNEVSNA
jgi:Myotubularin-like phosphatase domain